MIRIKPLSTTVFLMLSMFLVGSLVDAEIPAETPKVTPIDISAIAPSTTDSPTVTPIVVPIATDSQAVTPITIDSLTAVPIVTGSQTAYPFTTDGPITAVSTTTQEVDRAQKMPVAFKIFGVPRTKQLTNYCGPACLTSVIQHYGRKITQETIGEKVYDKSGGATNGADMLIYARDSGFSSYSFNTSVEDVKKKIAMGIPVIVLQQNSLADASGHYRVLTGYDDETSKFNVMDPYYDSITDMSYKECEQLWKKMGHWALLVLPTDKDTLKSELDDRNPVVHMDLSTALYKRKEYDEALSEANLALSMEPGNYYALGMVNKINGAKGAGGNK